MGAGRRSFEAVSRRKHSPGARGRSFGYELAFYGLTVARSPRSAGLLLNSFWRLLQVDPGFNPEGALAVSFYLPSSRYPRSSSRSSSTASSKRSFAPSPRVRAVGATTSLPLNKNESTRSFLVEGRAAPAPGERTPLPYRADIAGLLSGHRHCASERKGVRRA